MNKFCYEEGELTIADSQCEFCIHYHGGDRDSVCPTDQLAAIEQNEILCDFMEQESIL